MQTSNYAVSEATQDGFSYTLINKSAFYQKTIAIRERVLFKMVDLTVPIYKFFFKPKVSKWHVNVGMLKEFPEGTLGYDWASFYDKQPFSITDNYEEHDICHVLLGYKTSIIEETKMYAFLHGTGKISIPTFFTIIIGCLVLPEFALEFYQDYKKGKQALYFSNWDFRHLLHEKTDTLRQLIFRQRIMEDPDLFI